MNNHEILELIAVRAGLDDITGHSRTTEYVRARAVAVQILTDRGASRNEIARLLKREAKSVYHSRKTWPDIWAKESTALRLYRSCQAQLAD